jgi:cation transport ATPase
LKGAKNQKNQKLKNNMKKSHFNNKTVYWIIIAIIAGLFFWNLFVVIKTGNLFGLIPALIQAILLGLIFTKNQYAKIGTKIWAIVFLAIAYGLQFIGRLLKDLTESFSNVDLSHYLTTGVAIIIGITIVLYINKTVEIIES